MFSNQSTDPDGASTGTFSGPHLDYLLAVAGKASRVGPTRFGVLGHGPYSNAAITSALTARRREAYFAEVPVCALVVGRDGWQDGLHAVVQAHRGHELRVYSQEMLLTLLLTREDPHALGPARIVELFGDHPALRNLVEHEHFDWPTLRVPEPDSDDSSLPRGVFRDVGILDCFGYRVGYAAVRPEARQRALTRAYEKPVPGRTPPMLRDRIATERTPARLHQIADAIASQYRLASRRRNADMSCALEHWRDDLEWLKVRYYDTLESLPFRWPEVGDG